MQRSITHVDWGHARLYLVLACAMQTKRLLWLAVLRTCCLFVCLQCVSTSKIDCSLQCLRTCKAKLLHVVLSHRQHCCLSCFRIDSIVAGCALARTKHWLDAKRLRAKQIVCDKAVRLCLCIASFRCANGNFALSHKDFVDSNWCFRIQCY